MPNRNPWKTIEENVVYQNPWLRVREDKVLRPDGRPGIYGVVEIRPSVGAVALNERNEVALVGQWRYVSKRYSWEIPRGGSHDHDTDMLSAAKRELREEAGIDASDWRFLGALDVCNGVTTDVQHLYIATGLTLVASDPDPEEQIITRFMPFEEAVEMAMTGEITEVCTVTALLMAERLLRVG
jgi:8-oxo-dGTP pyrophosphatase MutT (NUDIX family)